MKERNLLHSLYTINPVLTWYDEGRLMEGLDLLDQLSIQEDPGPEHPAIPPHQVRIWEGRSCLEVQFYPAITVFVYFRLFSQQLKCFTFSFQVTISTSIFLKNALATCKYSITVLYQICFVYEYV